MLAACKLFNKRRTVGANEAAHPCFSQPTFSYLGSECVQGVILGAKALWEWEKTLQLIALIGITSSIYSRAQTYQSLDDVKADLRCESLPSF